MRKTGYYWAMLNGIWRIGLFSQDLWSFTHNSVSYTDNDLDQIDENLIIRKR